MQLFEYNSGFRIQFCSNHNLAIPSICSLFVIEGISNQGFVQGFASIAHYSTVIMYIIGHQFSLTAYGHFTITFFFVSGNTYQVSILYKLPYFCFAYIFLFKTIINITIHYQGCAHCIVKTKGKITTIHTSILYCINRRECFNAELRIVRKQM